jgi:hypothetical protein
MSGSEGEEGRESIHNTYIYIPHQNDLVVRPPSTGGNGGATAAPRRRHSDSKPHIRVLSTDAPHQRQRLLSDTHLIGEETRR